MKKKVAVLVPLSNATELTSDEQISLNHIHKNLSAYDTFSLSPKSSGLTLPGIPNITLPDEFFGSAEAHNQLLVSLEFYNRFQDYEFILMHHLDALTLSDQLDYWCDRGFDYIGPPWIKHPEAHYVGLPLENHVGGGGFSLRRVESCVKVLKAVKRPKLSRVYFQVRSGVMEKPESRGKEDVFWGTRAKAFWPKFNVAGFWDALQFGFECNPALAYETNKYRLPFGVHDWAEYDREFWEPHLCK